MPKLLRPQAPVKRDCKCDLYILLGRPCVPLSGQVQLPSRGSSAEKVPNSADTSPFASRPASHTARLTFAGNRDRSECSVFRTPLVGMSGLH